MRNDIMPDGTNSAPRFSLRTLLVFTVVFAVGCALLFSLPNVVAVPGLILVIVALPAVLTAGVMYGGRLWRAFCVGALFPAGLALYTVGWLFGLLIIEGPGPLEDWSELVELTEDIGFHLRVYAAASWVMAPVVGCLLAMFSRLAANRRDIR
jgi:hypothetical protein